MEVRQILRLLVFGFFSFLPNLLSYWVAVVLPEIIRTNLRVTKKSELSKIAGYFYSYFFLGLIVGSFAWPYIIRLVSKRMAVLLGLAFQGVFTLLTGMTLDLNWLFFFRFMTGFFNNINTVGKDFIFEFAKPEYRQYAFSLKSSFTMLGMWIGPLFGYYIYIYYDRSFEDSMAFLAFLYLIACVLFIVFFYLDFSPLEMESQIKVSISLQDENIDHPPNFEPEQAESVKLLESQKKPGEKDSRGIWEVITLIWRNKTLRDFVTVYLLSNGVGTTKNVLLIFYLEETWQEGGLGLAPVTISLVNVIVFVFCLAFLVLSPLVVPSKISYRGVTRDIVVMMMVTMLLMPALRDWLPNNTEFRWVMVIYVCYGLTSFFNPKLFSPFINFYLNDKVHKDCRTSMNSITFVGSCVAATLAMTFISPFFSRSMNDPSYVEWAPYNKYLVFVMMDVFLFVCLLFLFKKDVEVEV